MKLFDITEEQLELERLLDEYASQNEGDVTDFPMNDEFERLEGERADKLLNIGAWIKGIESEIDAHKAEQKRQGDRVRVLGNKAASLKSLISYHLANGEKLHDTRVALSYRRSERVVVDVATDKLGEGFTITTTTVTPDKKAIKAHLKDIEASCQFAHMEENFNLQVK